MQEAPEDIQWTVDKQEFDEMTATKIDSASHMAFADALVDWVCTSGSMRKDLRWKVVLSPHILLRAGPFSFPNLQPSTTMVLS